MRITLPYSAVSKGHSPPALGVPPGSPINDSEFDFNDLGLAIIPSIALMIVEVLILLSSILLLSCSMFSVLTNHLLKFCVVVVINCFYLI